MSGTKYYLNAGIDFGTSYTKVYVEDQYSGLRKPVLFGDARMGLLPSFVHLSGDQVTGPLDSDDGTIIPYLKLFIADEASGNRDYEKLYNVDHITPPPAQVLVTVFFVSLLRQIERFLKQDPDWESFSLRDDLLTAQVAVPTGLQGQDLKADAQILECLKAAFLLVREHEGIPSCEDVENCLNSLSSLPQGERDFLDLSCTCYPEVAAAVQALLWSGDLPEGKYITMDVGAGTVDMNFFFKRGANENEQDTSIDNWAARVAPLGCACLSSLRETAGDHEKVKIGMDEETMKRKLSEEIRSLMNHVFSLQPRRVVGDGPDVFHHGVYAYILGGGASVSIYEETLKKVLGDLDVRIAQVMRIPRPDLNYTLPNQVDDFGRLAVAYGVSATADNMETARLPDQMSAILRDAWERALESQPVTEIECTCFYNPDCAFCGGTGVIRRNEARANLNAILLLNAKREISEHNTEVARTWSDTERKLDKLLTGYGQIIRNDSMRYSRTEVSIFKRYAVLKKIEECLKNLPDERMAHWRADAQKVLDKAAREPRRKVNAKKGSARANHKGVIASLSITSGPQEPDFREFLLSTAPNEDKSIIHEINIEQTNRRYAPVMLKIIVPKFDHIRSRSIVLDARSMVTHSMRRWR